jgi:type IV pilus assembly protein PilM
MDIQFFQKLAIPKFGFLAGAPKSIIGVDFGTSAVKIVQLKKEKERAVLETYGALSVGPYANLSVGQAGQLADEKAVELLNDLLKESGVKAKDAAIAVPLKNTFITIIKLPRTVGDNLSEIISMEARRYIPLPQSEIEMDWWIIPSGLEEEDESGNKREFMEILLVAIHKETIENYKRIFSKADLHIRLLEIEIFSAIRSCLGREISPVLLIDIGASTTKMAIVDYGIIRSVHNFDRGSQDLTMALSNSLSIDFLRAEETKQEIGFSPRPEHKEIFSIIAPLAEYIFSEAGRFVSDYRRKNNRSIGRVILTGGGSQVKGLVDLAVKNFGIETSLADPFSKVEYPAFLSPVLRSAGPAFSTALGLALRGLQTI